MRDELIAIVKEAGATTVEQVVDLLIRERVITTKRMRRAVVRMEFYRILSEPGPVRTAHDIEQDLAARFGISTRTVQAIRAERHNKSK